MNRKDFDLLARAFKYIHHHVTMTDEQHNQIVRYVANTLDANAAGFDPAKFLDRCGVK